MGAAEEAWLVAPLLFHEYDLVAGVLEGEGTDDRKGMASERSEVIKALTADASVVWGSWDGDSGLRRRYVGVEASPDMVPDVEEILIVVGDAWLGDYADLSDLKEGWTQCQ